MATKATITQSDIATALQNAFKIGNISSLIYPNESHVMQEFMPVSDVEGTYHTPQMFLSELLQGFSTDFSHKGDINIKTNDITARRMKIDFKFSPEQVETNALSHLLNEENLPVEQRGLSKWILNFISDQLRKDIDKASINGEYDASDKTVLLNTVDGLNTILADMKTSTTNPCRTIFTTADGAPDADNIRDVMEAFEAGIPEQIIQDIDAIFLTRKMLRQYKKKTETAIGSVVWKGEDAVMRSPHYDIPLKAIPNADATNILYCTPKANRYRVYDKNAVRDLNPIVEVFERYVKLMMDWRFGIGFAVNELVCVADFDAASGDPYPSGYDSVYGDVITQS